MIFGFLAGLLLAYVGYLLEDGVLRGIGLLLAVVLAIPVVIRVSRRRGDFVQSLRQIKPMGWAIALAVLGVAAVPALAKESRPCGRIDLALNWSACLFRVNQRLYQGDLVFSPDGSQIAMVDAGRVVVREAATGRRVLTLSDRPQQLISVAFAPDGKTLAVGTQEGQLQRWSMQGDRLQAWTVHENHGVRQVAFTPGGDRLVALASAQDVTLWSLEGDAVGRLPHESPIDQIVVGAHQGQEVVVTSSASVIRLWELRQDAAPITLDGLDGIAAIALHPQGEGLAIADQNGAIGLWDLTPGTRQTQITKLQARIYDLAFADQEQTLGIATSTGEVQIWDLERQTQVETVDHRGAAEAVALSPAGDRVAVAIAPQVQEAVTQRPQGVRVEGQTVRSAQVTVWQRSRP